MMRRMADLRSLVIVLSWSNMGGVREIDKGIPNP